ncbi:hypothetical protein GCM10028786_16780 [Flaviaesturariibacter terrae]
MPNYPDLKKAYRLWLLGGFGLLGRHRVYLGKPRSARIWRCSLGVLGVGALLDLVFLPWLVKRMHMIERIQQLKAEIERTAAWREELARAQKYEEAAYNRDKEQLLRRELERLRKELSGSR